MITVLIPALNEEKSIGKTVSAFRSVGRVIVCDNGSHDETATIARSSGASVIFEPLQGKGHAVMALLREVSGIVLLVDGDNAFHPDDAKKMISLINDGKAEVVIGKRMNINDHNTNHPLLRSFCVSVLQYVFRLKYHSSLTDFFSGYRMLSKNAVKTFKNNLTSKGFDIEIEMTILGLKKGLVHREVPVYVQPRFHDNQKSNIFNVGIPVICRLFRRF